MYKFLDSDTIAEKAKCVWMDTHFNVTVSRHYLKFDFSRTKYTYMDFVIFQMTENVCFTLVLECSLGHGVHWQLKLLLR